MLTSVSKKHMQKYVDEFVVRYNNREAPAQMFERLISAVSLPSLADDQSLSHVWIWASA